MNRSEQSRNHAKEPRRRRARLWIVLGLLAALATYVAYVQLVVVERKDEGMRDVFLLLQEQGYVANVGLSGIFQPGSVIQTAEAGSDGHVQRLPTPLLFLWGSDCFPEMQPVESTFVLPQSAGSSSASLSLGAEMLSRLVPALQLDSEAVADYSLKLDNTRVLTIAKADLSRNFSEKCVRDLEHALDDGDGMEWFQVINEAVVADSLTLEVHWRMDSSAEARAALKRDARRELSGVVSSSDEEDPLSGRVRLGFDDEKRTLMAARCLVVIGYRSRALQPVE